MKIASLGRYLNRHPQSQFHHLIFLPNLLVRRIKLRTLSNQLIQKDNKLNFRSWDLSQFKNSDTLFILGCGGSINKLQKDQWRIIRQHDSIGFNFWLIHDFVPTYYVAETKGDKERVAIFFKNLNRKSYRYRNTPFIFKYSDMLAKIIDRIPSELKCVFLSSGMSVPGESEQALSRWIAILYLLGFFSVRNNGGLVVYSRSSLSWLLVFALNLGYHKIVFCGVDLNTVDYFFEHKQSCYQNKGMLIPLSGQPGNVHIINDPIVSGMGPIIQRVISIMNEKVLKPQKVKLYVGLPSSALYPEIPLYNWKLE